MVVEEAGDVVTDIGAAVGTEREREGGGREGGREQPTLVLHYSLLPR